MIAPPWLSRAQLRLSDQDDCGYDVKFAAIGRKWGIRVVVIGADAECSSPSFHSGATLDSVRTLLASIPCSYVDTASVGVVNCDSLH